MATKKEYAQQRYFSLTTNTISNCPTA